MQKVAAAVVIHRIPDMTACGRRSIACWLRRIAKDITNEPQAFAKVFRARFHYEAPAKGKRK